jgi:hypothetical protein
VRSLRNSATVLQSPGLAGVAKIVSTWCLEACYCKPSRVMGTTNSLQASRLEAGAYQTAGAIDSAIGSLELWQIVA